MKYGVFVFPFVAIVLTCTSVAKTAGNARWIGVWLDGRTAGLWTDRHSGAISC